MLHRQTNLRSARLMVTLFVFGVHLAGLGTVSVFGQSPEFGAPLKVMSFNIRYGTANDGDNHWKKRHELVAETIQVFDPDLLGVQEALKFQAEFLKQSLPNHEFFGRGRQAKPDAGEFSAIYFRRGRFEKTDGGHFWLSETPDRPGSKSWDSSLPRMVTWVRLKDRYSDNREFVFANTHFDHRGPEARRQSATLIRKRMVNENDLPVLLTGDFNTRPTDQPYQTLTDGDGRKMIDTFAAAHNDLAVDSSTMTGWNGRRQGNRIDWVLHSPAFTTLSASINYYNQQGRYPSDHYPVQAIVKLRLNQTENK